MKICDAYQVGPYVPGKPAEEQPTIVYLVEEPNQGKVAVVHWNGKREVLPVSLLQGNYRGNIRGKDLEKMLKKKAK